jgi:uncharacterized protein
MIEFVFTFVILLAVVAAMAIGVMRGRAPISGSCGGLNNLGVDGACEICGGNPAKCDSQEDPEEVSTRFYDADASRKV